jgi:hypothetical protein
MQPSISSRRRRGNVSNWLISYAIAMNRQSATDWTAGALLSCLLLFILAPMMRDNPAVLWPSAGLVVILAIGLWVWGRTSGDRKRQQTKMHSIGIMVGGIVIYGFGALWYYKENRMASDKPVAEPLSIGLQVEGSEGFKFPDGHIEGFDQGGVIKNSNNADLSRTKIIGPKKKTSD